MRSLALLLGIFLTTIPLLPTQFSQAVTTSVPEPSNAPLQLDLLKDPKGSVITANTVSQRKLSIPSLWLAKENSENQQILDNWIAYPATNTEPARVDLVVNQQVWTTLDYLERYDFVNRFGTVARNYGYNVRVFDYQKERLATYTCNFITTPTSCSIKINTKIK
ncbi:MAG: hypothetical protein DSM106950_11235 [Stigonema ocellatum SAG 48.90 = DSM 106950]|nr:hypothetical protein [Stigonema ocellatum SAG 48.90 = DSM 106950]